MIETIKSFLQSLNEFPKEKFPPEFNTPPYVRAYIYLNYLSIMSAIFHAVAIIIFAIFSVQLLAIFNIFSVIVWVATFFLIREGYIWRGYIIGAIEVIAHAALCVVVIGWDAGFQYYVFIQPIIIVFTPWKNFVKILIAATFTFSFMAMAQYAFMSDPYIELSTQYLLALNYINIFSAIIYPFLGTFIYYNTTIKVEEKLKREHQRTNKALSERNKILSLLNEELTEAAEYVKTILPQPISNDFVQIDWRFIPSTSLGGDAFGYHMIDDDNLAFYIVDVSGHGVGAALLSVSVINVLRSHSLPKTDFKQPDQVLSALNHAFPSESNKDMFFTMWYGVYNKNNRNLVYASGGHPPAILIGSDGQNESDLKLLRTKNYVIGGLPDSEYSKDDYSISENYKLYIYSDGVYEVETTAGSMWRCKDFQRYMREISLDGNAVLDKLHSHVKSINIKDVFPDDFTILEVGFK
jgi:sigma-B regulation protein RsbU (phosphoserine phosphatase)